MTKLSKRLAALPSYPMAEIPAIKRRLLERGVDVIDLGAGDADFAPPAVAIDTLARAVRDPAMSRYPFQLGLPAFREAAAAYLRRRFGARFDPFSELHPLIGSKEGIAHLAMALLDPGDVGVVPEPGYAVYEGGTVLAGAEPYRYPLIPETGFLLELSDLPSDVVRRTKLVYLNYPNNPTAAVAPRDYLARTVEFCRRHGIVIAYDNPYCEITFDGYVAPSIFEIAGAREVAVEFHSLSKTFCMTGWRLAWAVARPELIAEAGFLLELSDLPADVVRRTKLVYLNYPNNPTAAVAPRDYLARTVEFCRRHGIVIAYDNPYCEITFDGYVAPSIFEIAGAREVAVEFHSLSKTFCMTGWRLAWAVARPELIAALARVKNYVDTGAFLAVQAAGAAVLPQAEELARGYVARFQERRDALLPVLRAQGFEPETPGATMYVWVPLPEGVASAAFARRALEDAGVVTLPGSGFGAGGGGEGFFRLALTVDTPRLIEAAERLGKVLATV